MAVVAFWLQAMAAGDNGDAPLGSDMSHGIDVTLPVITTSMASSRASLTASQTQLALDDSNAEVAEDNAQLCESDRIGVCACVIACVIVL